MIRVGTRRSPLALAQARLVSSQLPDAELVEMDTAGDRRDLRFEQIGDGRGVFTREIERALLAGEIDVAVHSAKDLTGEMPDGLVIGAIPTAQGRAGRLLRPVRLPGRAAARTRVYAARARRAARLGELRPDLEVVPLRDNVYTRLRKLDDGDAEAIVLAAAGLLRLGLGERIGFLFDPAEFAPEAGQGALAVQVRAGEEQLVANALQRRSFAGVVEAERARVANWAAGCTVPVAAHAWARGRRYVDAHLGRPHDGVPRRRRARRPGAADVPRQGACWTLADVVVYDRLSADLLDLAARVGASASTSASGRAAHGDARSGSTDCWSTMVGGRDDRGAGSRAATRSCFARGGEEAAALEAAGVGYEVVPGHHRRPSRRPRMRASRSRSGPWPRR